MKTYLVGKVMDAESNLPGMLLTKGDMRIKVNFILKTTNKSEAYAVAKWYGAKVVEV